MSRISLSLVFLSVVVMPPPARAETRPRELDPMVVTAESASGSVLSPEDMDFFQVRSVADLPGLVPGLSVVTSDGGGYGDIISMRGSANALFFSSPSVGMIVDDVPMGDVSSYPAGLLDLDQIMVLSGPQGTMFGRNGTAGMIEMTTPRPGKHTQTRLATDYGSYDSWGVRLQSAGPLGDGFAQAFQIYHQERDGFLRNTTTGGNPDSRDISGGLANLYWKPAEDTEWRLRILAEREDDGSQRLSLLRAGDPFDVASDIPGETVIERQQVSLHWTKEGRWGKVKSITAWQNWELNPNVVDLDLLNTPGYGASSKIVQDQKLWSQEFRWESPEDAGPWAWRTGVFFMDQSSGGDTFRILGGPYSESINYQLDQWNLAAYGRVYYAVNDRLEILAGGRLEYVDSRIDRTKTTNYALPVAPVHDDMNDCYFSPEVGARYSLSDDMRLFARSAIGIKPGGYSAFASTPSQARYQEETEWANEVGAECVIPENHLTLSLVGFWNLTHDYQVNRPDVDYSTDYFTVNADQVTATGVNAEVKWQPVEGLTLQGSAGYVNAGFDEYEDPLVASVDYQGNAVPFVPNFTGSLGVRYEFPNGFYAQTTLRMMGETYFNEANDHNYRQDAYQCWDAEVGFVRNDFRIALFGRNMLDEGYYTYINYQIEAGSPGDPQVFGVRASYEF